MHAQVESFLNYIEFEKRSSKHTHVAYANDLAQFEFFLKSFEQEIQLATHIDIRNWIVSMMEQKISARSINRKVSALKSFYKFLLRRGEIKKTPLAKVQTPKTVKRLPAFVEQTGTDRLLNDIDFPDNYEGMLAKMVIELLYGTGMRRSELIHLKESDVDSYNSQLKVLGKRNKERIIPIHSELRSAIKVFLEQKKKLKEATADEIYLLTDMKGNKLSERFVYSTVKKYLNLVTTVEKKSPHTLRHTYATHLLNNGADINAVKELLGHSSLAATQVYTHNTIDKLKNIYKQAHPKA